MKLTVILSILLVMSIETTYSAVDVVTQEKRLTKYLMDRYVTQGPTGRPVNNNETTITRVELGLDLIQILELDERSETITLRAWCKYKWNDTSLAWNKADVGGVESVRIPIDHIWKPDIVLLNSVEERSLTGPAETMASVKSNGSVTWRLPAVYKTTCYTSTTDFPFDEVKCWLEFRSWSYNGNSLDLEFFSNEADIGLALYMNSNDQWQIIEHTAVKHVKVYDMWSSDEIYPDLTFYLTFRRKGTFYSYLFILPYFTFMLVNLATFLLPPESSAKTTLGLGIAVGYWLLLVCLHNYTPLATHGMPTIGVCYCVHMVITAISTLLCALIVNLHFTAERQKAPPTWLKKLLINYGARFLLIKTDLPESTQQRKGEGDTPVNKRVEDEENSRLLNHASSSNEQDEINSDTLHTAVPSTSLAELNEETPAEVVKKVPSNAQDDGFDTMTKHNKTVQSPMSSNLAALETKIQEVTKTLYQCSMKTQLKERKIQSSTEWRIISQVLDRFLFLLYLLCILISLVAFPLYKSDMVEEAK